MIRGRCFGSKRPGSSRNVGFLDIYEVGGCNDTTPPPQKKKTKKKTLFAPGEVVWASILIGQGRVTQGTLVYIAHA